MKTENTPKEFICQCCNSVYTQGWSDEERDAEYERNFADVAEDEPKALVCDMCYKLIMSDREIK